MMYHVCTYIYILLHSCYLLFGIIPHLWNGKKCEGVVCEPSYCKKNINTKINATFITSFLDKPTCPGDFCSGTTSYSELSCSPIEWTGPPFRTVGSLCSFLLGKHTQSSILVGRHPCSCWTVSRSCCEVLILEAFTRLCERQKPAMIQ